MLDRPHGGDQPIDIVLFIVASAELSASIPVSSPGYVPQCEIEVGTKYLLYLMIIIDTKKYLA